MAVLCERPPELLTPPNVIITQNKNHNHNSINNNGHSMRVRLVEVGSRVEYGGREQRRRAEVRCARELKNAR